MNIDCSHLKTFDTELYRQLVCYPQEVIPTIDMAVNEVFFEKYPDAQLQHQIQVLLIIIIFLFSVILLADFPIYIS